MGLAQLSWSHGPNRRQPQILRAWLRLRWPTQSAGDAFAEEIVAEGARQADVLIRSLVEFGAPRISLLGGLASRMVQWLSPEVVHFLSPPEADAVAGVRFWPGVKDRSQSIPAGRGKVHRYAD